MNNNSEWGIFWDTWFEEYNPQAAKVIREMNEEIARNCELAYNWIIVTPKEEIKEVEIVKETSQHPLLDSINENARRELLNEFKTFILKKYKTEVKEFILKVEMEEYLLQLTGEAVALAFPWFEFGVALLTKLYNNGLKNELILKKIKELKEFNKGYFLTITWVNAFYEKNREEIDSKVNWYRNLKRDFEMESNLYTDNEWKDFVWTLWEYLFKECIKWELNEAWNFLSNWDVTKDWRTYDVKTLNTKTTLKSNLKRFNNWKFYIREDQVKRWENLIMVPCLINREEDTAIIFLNNKMTCNYIKEKYIAKPENPFNTKTVALVNNYVIRYQDICDQK